MPHPAAPSLPLPPSLPPPQGARGGGSATASSRLHTACTPTMGGRRAGPTPGHSSSCWGGGARPEGRAFPLQNRSCGGSAGEAGPEGQRPQGQSPEGARGGRPGRDRPATRLGQATPAALTDLTWPRESPSSRHLKDPPVQTHHQHACMHRRRRAHSHTLTHAHVTPTHTHRRAHLRSHHTRPHIRVDTGSPLPTGTRAYTPSGTHTSGTLIPHPHATHTLP